MLVAAGQPVNDDVRQSQGWRRVLRSSPGRMAALPALAAVAFFTAPALYTNAAGLSGDVLERRLKSAYPDHISAVEGNAVIFKDGTRLPLDGGSGQKDFDAWLARPDIADMFRFDYPAGTALTVPAQNFDPGRARNTAFFDKIYGNCRSGEVRQHLVSVVWLKTKAPQRVLISARNGAAEKLRAVSTELDALPGTFDRFLFPIAGSYVCRAIAGTSSPSAHGYGIAIDIALSYSNYWRWDQRRDPLRRVPAYRNAIPIEIVAIFEKHGFIWGGRWSHYDTMHFEYRPELIDPQR